MKVIPLHSLSRIVEIGLTYSAPYRISELPVVCSSNSAYQLFKESWDQNTIELLEQCRVMLLNRANRVLGICTLSTGSGTGTIIDPKLVFVIALKGKASQIIVAHNHPSGSLGPSIEDRTITKKLKEGGALLDVKVADHLIISTEGYYSFADEGAL